MEISYISYINNDITHIFEFNCIAFFIILAYAIQFREKDTDFDLFV